MTLLACLGVALCVQVLSVVVICGVKALEEESTGRDQSAARDHGLGLLRCLALDRWAPVPWTPLAESGEGTAGRLTDVEGSLGWVLGAEVREEPASTVITTSAWVERGRDGLDLPGAAVVGAAIIAAQERVTPWLVGEGDDTSWPLYSSAACAVGFVGRVEGSTVIGEGCRLEPLDTPWDLDDGWRSFFASERCFGDQVWVVHAAEGESVALRDVLGGVERSSPCLVIVTGGGVLDARWEGDLTGVLVVDGGSVLLEGTALEGAVFATGTVNVGLAGSVVSRPEVRRWATDVALRRDRIAPGTRAVGTQ